MEDLCEKPANRTLLDRWTEEVTKGEMLEYSKYRNKANWAKRHVLRADALVKLHEKIIKKANSYLWCERHGVRVDGDHIEDCDQLN